MLQVKHKITIGSATFTDGKQTRLVDFKLEAALEVPVNSCRLILAPPKDLQPAVLDKFTVELGYDSLQLVFTGLVTNVEWHIDRVVVYAASSFGALLTARYNLYYDKPKASDIVSGVAGQLKISSGKVESGSKFTSYALGEHQTAYQHLKTLAQLCGFDLYANTEDKLIFAKYKAATTHKFTFGKEILGFDLEEHVAPISGVEVYGESPASGGQGEQAASWFTKKEVKGTAGGSSGQLRRVINPAARTQQLAGQLAAGLLAVYSPKQHGTLKVLGAPQVKLGDAVQVSGMPASKQNATFKVSGVAHQLNVQRGFFTRVEVQET